MVRKLRAGLGGGPNLKSVGLTVEEKYYFSPVLTCPSEAKKSCGSHLLGVGPVEADKTALVQESSKAITFLS